MAFTEILDSIPMEMVFGGVGILIAILIAIVLFLLLWQWHRRKKALLVSAPAPPPKRSDPGMKKTVSSWKQKSVLPLEQELAHINNELQTLPQMEFLPGRTITSLPFASATSRSPARALSSTLPRASCKPVLLSPSSASASELSRIEQQLASLGSIPLPLPPAPQAPAVKKAPIPDLQAPKVFPNTKTYEKKTSSLGKGTLVSLNAPVGTKVGSPKWALLPEPKLQKMVIAPVTPEKRTSFFQRLFHRKAMGGAVPLPAADNTNLRQKEVRAMAGKAAVPQQAPTKPAFPKPVLEKTSLKPQLSSGPLPPKPSLPATTLSKPALSKPASASLTPPLKKPMVKTAALPSEKDQLARLQEGINQLKKRMESA